MAMQRSNQRMRRLRRLKPLAATTACLYLLVSALLVLCMAHPYDGHSHSQASGHIDVVCVWVQKAIYSHTLSAAAPLPAVEAVFFLLVSFPLPVALIRVVQLTGRSPPNTPSFA